MKDEGRAEVLKKLAEHCIEAEKELIADGKSNTDRAYIIQFVEDAYLQCYRDHVEPYNP